jgi:hypothetical protein
MIGTDDKRGSSVWKTMLLGFLIGASATLLGVFYMYNEGQSGRSGPSLKMLLMPLLIMLIVAAVFPRTKVQIFSLIAGVVSAICGLLLLIYASSGARIV